MQPGEDCSSPTQLAFNADGIATFAADNSQYVNNGQGSCGDANDRVFRFDLSVPAWVGFSSSGLAAYHARSVCTDPGTEELCRTSTALEFLQGGSHFLWAEGSGPFTVTLHRYAPGDRCVNVEPLAFSPSGTATASGSTLGYSSESPICSAPGRDRVYSFTTTRPQRLSATLSAAGYTPVLGLQAATACEQPTAVACSARTGTSAQLDNVRVPPGSHVLWLDAVEPTAVGTFDLRAALTDPLPGDACDSPIRLSSPAAVVSGDTRAMTDDAAFCGGDRAPDMTFQLTHPAPGPFSAVVMSQASSPLLPVVDLVSSCTATSAIGCSGADSGVAFLSRTSLDAGTYFIHVDGLSGSAGPFGLATIQGVPDAGTLGDSCSNAIQVPADVRPLALGGSTANAGLAGNHAADCRNTGTAAAPDLVYRLDVPSAGTLTVTGVPLLSSFDLILALQSGSNCNATAPELTCRDVGASGVPETLTYSVPAAGRYWLWVTGWDVTDLGPFHLLIAFR